MKRKLYSNMRRMTTFFCLAIAGVTLGSLFLRLTVFSDMVALAAHEVSEPEAPEEAEPGFFPYTINRKVHFDTPQSKGDFRIQNPEINEYYMTVSVVLPETGENLLYTGFVKPGQSRDAAALHIQIPEGVYDCIAEVTAFDPETLKPRGSEEREITLYIGKKTK